MPRLVFVSAVVELCPHGVKPPAGDAIGIAVPRRNQSALPQAAEGEERAVAQYPALSRHAGYVCDFSLFVFFNAYVAAARERMQHPLFELRDIDG